MIHQVNDIFDGWLTGGGIFTLLSAVQGGHELPWEVDPSILDIDYHGNHSGSKIISPLLVRLLKADGGEQISIIHKSQIAIVIYNRFIDNWIRRWEALQAEYSPLENYSMVENMNDDVTEHEKGTTMTRTLNTEKTRTGTETTTPDTEITAEGSVYGYDSSQPSPSDKAVTTTSGTNETEYDLADAETGTVTDAETGTDTDTRNYELTRKGNIGVTTSQQMLQAELEVRTYDFFKSVYEDIDKVLTIPVY